jgi:hypothetical protein
MIGLRTARHSSRMGKTYAMCSKHTCGLPVALHYGFPGGGRAFSDGYECRLDTK